MYTTFSRSICFRESSSSSSSSLHVMAQWRWTTFLFTIILCVFLRRLFRDGKCGESSDCGNGESGGGGGKDHTITNRVFSLQGFSPRYLCIFSCHELALFWVCVCVLSLSFYKIISLVHPFTTALYVFAYTHTHWLPGYIFLEGRTHGSFILDKMKDVVWDVLGNFMY